MKKGNKSNSKPKIQIQQDKQYTQFLEQKIKKEHYINHLINHNVDTLDDENSKLKEQIAKSRKIDSKRKKQIKQLTEELQIMKKKIISSQFQKQKLQKKLKTLQINIQKENNNLKTLQAKAVFKQFLNNSFPKHKETIKKVLRFFMHLQKHSELSSQKRIETYRQLISSFVKRFMDFIFPKKNQSEKSKSIAQNLVQKWKQNSTYSKDILAEVSYLKNKEIKNIDKIQQLQAELLKLNASKSMLESRVNTYEKTLKIKASQFVVHFKKSLSNESIKQLQEHQIQQIKQTLQIFNSLVHQHQQKNLSETNKNSTNILPVLHSQKQIKETKFVFENSSSKKIIDKKAPPILKKNIFGFYKQPQFQKYNNLTLTKHPNLNKQTQTIPDDLAILTFQPVLLLHLFDGNIKPQRNRHCTEYYVQICKNIENSVSSQAVNSIEPVWNRKFLLKDYDFPFLKINLMNKSKGLRDQIIGQSKMLVDKSESKIVNLKKEKQFQGRVRFGIWYPKGNIFQFFINSIQLILPENVHILNQEVKIECPMNETIIQKFNTTERIKFINKSFIILQDYEGSLEGSIKSLRTVGSVNLTEFTKKQGNKQIVIQVQQWKIILDGYVVLLVCENQQPQKINEQELKDDRFFAVRAGHPLVSATYNQLVLYTHVKLPLIFRYTDDCQTLSFVKQTQNATKLEENIVHPLLNSNQELKVHEILSTPSHIYQFCLVTLEGQQVKFSYQSNLYSKLPQNIKLQIVNSELQNQNSQTTMKDKRIKKGERALQKQSDNKITFFIQTKELMPNYYRVFNKTFKLTSFSKFKIGYKVVKNLLNTEGKPKNQIQQINKLIQVQTPLQGEFYIQIRVQKAYLPNLSSSSKYSIQLKNVSNQLWQNKTEQIQSNRCCPQWKHSFLIKFLFKANEAVPKFAFRLRETSLLSNKIIYEGQIPLTKKLLHLGKLYLKLNKEGEQSKFPKQDIIIFSNIKIPNECLSVFIDTIQCQVEEKSDWIGEIDPYIKIFKNQHQIYKTKVIDGAGDNSIWNNLQFKAVLSIDQKLYQKDQKSMKKFEVFQCQIFDEDIINDDYLGISKVQFDPQIVKKDLNQISCIRSNIIKDEKVTGSLKFTGKFKLIKQQVHKIKTFKTEQIDPKMQNIYKISVFKINLNDQKLTKSQDPGIITYQNLMDNKRISKKFTLKKDQLQAFDFSFWKVLKNRKQEDYITNDRVNLIFQHQTTSFLQKKVEVLGQVSFLFSDLKNSLNQVRTQIFDILSKEKNVVGKCHVFIQPINQIKYSVIDCFSCGTSFSVQTDIHDNCLLYPNQILAKNVSNLSSIDEDVLGSYLLYDQIIKIKKQNCQSNKTIPQISYNSKKIDQINDIKVCLKQYNLDQNLGVLSLFKQNVYKKMPTYQKYQKLLNKVEEKLYKIKMIHWQPTKFVSKKQYHYDLKFNHQLNDRHISFNKYLNETYNSYYLFNLKEQNKLAENYIQDLIVFTEGNFPKQIDISSEQKSGNFQNTSVNIQNSFGKYEFIKDDGVLYYEVEPYYGKYRVVDIQVMYIRFAPNFFKQFFCQVTDKNLIDIQITVNQSSIFYSSAIKIGNDGFLFKSLRFFLTKNISDNKFKLNIKPNLFKNSKLDKILNNNENEKEVQIQIKGKNNEWEYTYLNTKDYCLHSKILIQTDISVGKQLQKLPPPTQISFIQMMSIQLIPTARLSSKQLKIRFYLHNQCLEMITSKKQEEGFTYELQERELLYIYQGKQPIIKVQVIQERVFGDKLLGVGHITLTQNDIFLTNNELTGQISNQQTIIGKVKFSYKCVPLTKYLYVDIDKIITKYPYPQIIIQMKPVGVNKCKYQKIPMRLIQKKKNQQKNKVQNGQIFEYDTSEDLILAQNDYQDYNIHVVIRETLQQIGKFKLCQAIKKDNDNDHQQVSAVHPLRIVSNQLNGLISINYIQYVSSQKQIESNQASSNSYFNMVIKYIRFHNQHEAQKLSLLFQTSLRKLYSKQQEITSNQFCFSIIIAGSQRINIILLRKQQKLAYASIAPPFIHKQQKIIIFKKYLDNSPFGIFKIYFCQTFQNKIYYQIDSFQATGLADMQLFAKMNPYTVIETTPSIDLISLKIPKKQALRTQISVGKQHLFWKVNLILDGNAKMTVFDKDMAFDDYIGECEYIFNPIQIQQFFKQNQQSVFKKQLKLISKQDNNAQNGNATLSLRQIKSSIKIQKLKFQHIQKSMVKIILDDLCSISALQTSLFTRLIIAIHKKGNSQNIFKLMEFNHEGGMANILSKPLLLPITFIDFQNYSLVLQLINQKQNKVKVQSIQMDQKSLASQNKAGQIIFKSVQIVPQIEQVFTLQKLHFWYDFMTFNKFVQIQFIVKQQSTQSNIDLKTNFYQLNIDLGQNQKKNNGTNLISINSKILQQNIRIYPNCKLQITIKDKLDNTNIDICNLKIQSELHHNMIIQTDIIRPSSKNMKIGNIVLEIDKNKSNLSNFNSSQIQNRISRLKNIEQMPNVRKSQYRWIKIKVLKAKLLIDLQWFSKMDPYCQIQYSISGQTQPNFYRTTVKDDIGQQPIWNETFFILLTSFSELKDQKSLLNLQKCQKLMKIRVMDEEVTKNRQIGSGILKIQQGQQNNLKISLLHDQKQDAGWVSIQWSIHRLYIVFVEVLQFTRPQFKHQDPILFRMTNKDQMNENEKLREKDWQSLAIGNIYPFDISDNLQIKTQNQITKILLKDLYQRSQDKFQIYLQQKLPLNLKYMIFE